VSVLGHQSIRQGLGDDVALGDGVALLKRHDY
jgi:hypothetical protein